MTNGSNNTPGGARCLFGDEAMNYDIRLHLSLIVCIDILMLLLHCVGFMRRNLGLEKKTTRPNDRDCIERCQLLSGLHIQTHTEQRSWTDSEKVSFLQHRATKPNYPGPTRRVSIYTLLQKSSHPTALLPSIN